MYLLLTPHTSEILIAVWLYLHLSNLLLYALRSSIVYYPHLIVSDVVFLVRHRHILLRYHVLKLPPHNHGQTHTIPTV